MTSFPKKSLAFPPFFQSGKGDICASVSTECDRCSKKQLTQENEQMKKGEKKKGKKMQKT